MITAPFAGVVTKRYANTGSMIQAGTASQTQAMPVVRLSQNGLLRLHLPVPESAVPHVHLGEPVDVRVSALDRTFPGRVARFADKVDQSTRTMETEVDVPNPNAGTGSRHVCRSQSDDRTAEHGSSRFRWKPSTALATRRAYLSCSAAGAIRHCAGQRSASRTPSASRS